MNDLAFHLRGYVCVGETPDGYALLIPEQFADTIDVTNVDPRTDQQGDTVSPKPKATAPAPRDYFKVCVKCRRELPLPRFKRIYTAQQIIRMGYATANPAHEHDKRAPAYSKIPRVPYESTVCLDCKPASPFFRVKTRADIIFARTAGILHMDPDAADLIARATLAKRDRKSKENRDRANSFKRSKKELTKFLARLFAAELAGVKRRVRYIDARPYGSDLPRDLWRSFLREYEYALVMLEHDFFNPMHAPDPEPEAPDETPAQMRDRLDRDAAAHAEHERLVKRNVTPGQYIPKALFLYTWKERPTGWESREVTIMKLWVEGVCKRAERDAAELPLGKEETTFVQQFLAQMHDAWRRWDECTALMHREKSMPALLEMFHPYLKKL